MCFMWGSSCFSSCSVEPQITALFIKFRGSPESNSSRQCDGNVCSSFELSQLYLCYKALICACYSIGVMFSIQHMYPLRKLLLASFPGSTAQLFFTTCEEKLGSRAWERS